MDWRWGSEAVELLLCKLEANPSPTHTKKVNVFNNAVTWFKTQQCEGFTGWVSPPLSSHRVTSESATMAHPCRVPSHASPYVNILFQVNGSMLYILCTSYWNFFIWYMKSFIFSVGFFQFFSAVSFISHSTHLPVFTIMSSHQRDHIQKLPLP
jgi:hypothetical protein